MRCRPPAPRAPLARWLALLPLLLAAVWLLHLAGHLQSGDDAGPAAESCLVCLHLAGQGTPLPATPPALAVVAADLIPVIAGTPVQRHSPAPLPRQGAPPRV